LLGLTRGLGLEMNFGLGVLAFLAVLVNRFGYGFGFVEAFGAGLVYLGGVLAGGLSSFRVQHVLGTFHEVVGGFLHGGGGFFHYAAVRYGIGGVGGNLLYLVGSGRRGVRYFIEQPLLLYARLFFSSASTAGVDVAKRDFSSSRSTFFSTGVRSKFLILRVSLLARAMFLRCLRFRRVTDMISGEMRISG